VDQEISSEIPYNGKYICNFSVCNYEKKKKTNKKRAICAMKNSDLNFRKFPLMNANGTAFSGISGKENNLARYTEIFGNFLLGISVPFDLPPGIFGSMIRFSEIQQLPNTFSGIFRAICPRFGLFG